MLLPRFLRGGKKDVVRILAKFSKMPATLNEDDIKRLIELLCTNEDTIHPTKAKKIAMQQ